MTYYPVKIVSGNWDDRAVGMLSCPQCGGHNLHHGSTIVFDRNEDEHKVQRTTVVHNAAYSERVVNSDSGNPSARRDGSILGFTCENCHNPLGGTDHIQRFQLKIWQHKGSTYLAWEL